ncbi:DUF4199 domain-containing protein [Litoribacter ruber]|uniref:DUF4199 domain-containing protein n=1 Tax=Litoribacter ruber TaxID=702568 RepID=UPI001BD95DC1|nr:DUF4199 domain-containing protein [Litoribacter ruber]MBT0811811.1 DUF4199 domain-containing protein [Litoribacter ruber]
MNRYLLSSYKFGLAAGVLGALAFWVLKLSNLEPVSFTLIFGYMVIPVFLFLGIKNFRDYHNDQELFFAQGMTVGFFIYSIFGLFLASMVSMFLMFQPEIFNEYIQMNLDFLVQRKDQITEEMGLSTYESLYQSSLDNTVSDIFFDYLAKITIFGLLSTIIITVILKQSKI